MEKFLVTGGQQLKGTVSVSGAKNASLKALVAACLTDEEIIIENIPLISDFFLMVDIMKGLGAKVIITDHSAHVRVQSFNSHEIPLDKAARARTSSMFIAPLLARVNEAIIPNPGGCRLGARPIDRIIDGLRNMNADITYNSDDGYFHAKTQGLRGMQYTFEKNSHTGTETLIMAACLAEGTTILKNAAEEPEIDELITLLTSMGAHIRRTNAREITIEGVKKLHGGSIRISPDRNEIVTMAIASVVTKGDIFIPHITNTTLTGFLEKLAQAGGGYEEKDEGIRFFYKGKIKPIDVTTSIYPGFMTDWQAPWAILMTQATGISVIHETVFENKLGYVHELRKMGANIEFFNPPVNHPEIFYNFNKEDDKPEYFHAIRIYGPTDLHDGILQMIDLRAGAAVVIAALAAKGTSTIFGIDKLDRGYEKFDERLKDLGAKIIRSKEESVKE